MCPQLVSVPARGFFCALVPSRGPTLIVQGSRTPLRDDASATVIFLRGGRGRKMVGEKCWSHLLVHMFRHLSCMPMVGGDPWQTTAFVDCVSQGPGHVQSHVASIPRLRISVIWRLSCNWFFLLIPAPAAYASLAQPLCDEQSQSQQCGGDVGAEPIHGNDRFRVGPINQAVLGWL